MKITRRQFLGATIATSALAACGDDGGGGSDAASRNCATNGVNATISANHGHVITVTSAEVAAAADKTYDIMGTAGHTHSVMVTAANFASLTSNPNGSIQVTSTSSNSHTHTVTILCA